MECPGCGISYCLDCEESVDPRLYRCEPCLIEHNKNDPFAQTAREYAKHLRKLEAAAKVVLSAVSVGGGKIVCPQALLEPIRALAKTLEKTKEII